MPYLVACLIFASVLAAGVYFAFRPGAEGTSEYQLMARIARPASSAATEILKAQTRSRSDGTLYSLLYRLDLTRRLEEHLWQAGIYMRVSDMVLLMLVLFGSGTVIGTAVWQSPVFATATGCGLAAAPIAYVRVRRKRRLRRFVLQLPFALDLIRSSLEAGHSLLRGLQVVVSEFQDPMSTELRSVIEQSRLGLPLPRALEEMLKRVPVDDLRLFVVAVRVQSEVGSSLAQIINRLAEIVRTRQRVQDQVRALTAQSRMSGWVVGCLPIIILGAFSVIQPSYTHVLFHDPAGIRILKVAAVLDGLAFATIRKLLKVKF
jgi:tight adherence protein B